MAGFAEWNLPLLGGTLVPSPDVYASISVNVDGALDVTIPWPTLPRGTELTTQTWFFDPGASHLWSASNAVRMIAQ